MAVGYEDRVYVCRECGKKFVFTAGEQEFYAKKGFLNDPVRCSACRRARRQAGGRTAPRSNSRGMRKGPPERR